MKLQNENREKVEALNQYRRRTQLTQLKEFLNIQSQAKKDREMHQRAAEMDSDHSVFPFNLTTLEGPRLAQAFGQSHLPESLGF
jgi:hypothetical protein